MNKVQKQKSERINAQRNAMNNNIHELRCYPNKITSDNWFKQIVISEHWDKLEGRYQIDSLCISWRNNGKRKKRYSNSDEWSNWKGKDVYPWILARGQSFTYENQILNLMGSRVSSVSTTIWNCYKHRH